MLKKILLGFAAVIALFLMIVAFQPAPFRVERSTTVSAPPSAVFAQVNDLHKWKAWSPWANLDPAMKVTHEGPPAGVGAVYSWEGNSKVGAGRMTIIESRPQKLVQIKLEFLKPFQAINTTDFTFKPEGNQTTVNWSMFGEKNFLSKAMCLFVSMDKMVGGDFEKGLASMKSVAEGSVGK